MKFLERFSKYPQTRPDKSIIAKVQLDRETGLVNITAKLHKFGRFIRNTFQTYRYSVKFLSIYKQSSQNHITLCQGKTATHAVHWLIQRLSFREVPIPIAKMIVRHSESIAVLRENIHSYVTTTDFLTLLIYKLQNAQWIEELQCAQKILVFFLMCELNVTVKLYTAACSLMQTHISSQINLFSITLLDVCTTAQEYIGTNFRQLKAKWSRRFKGIWSEFNIK